MPVLQWSLIDIFSVGWHRLYQWTHGVGSIGVSVVSAPVNNWASCRWTVYWNCSSLKRGVVKSWSRPPIKIEFFLSFQKVNSNVRSCFLIKLPLLDHITMEHGRLKIRDYLPLPDPVIPPFIRKTFLSLWTLFKLNYIPKESSFSPLSNGISEYKTYPAFDFFCGLHCSLTCIGQGCPSQNCP